MFKNYLKIALRNIQRKKIYSFISILGLAIGMACFILIGLWVKDELSFDRFYENKDRIYRVLNTTRDGRSFYNISYALAPALKAQYPEVVESCRVWFHAWGLIKYGDKGFEQSNIYLADPSFFKIFSFPFIKGNPDTALADLFSVVLTEDAARKYFEDEDPLGKVLEAPAFGVDLKVTGVIKNPPGNSHLRFEFISRIEYLGEDRLARWEEWSGPNYVLLKPGVSQADFEEKISGIYKKNIRREVTYIPELQPLTRIHLYEFGRPGQIKKVTMFSVIAVFILLMACINFMNLTIAQSTKRAREVGMRKVIGARRRQIIRQFLGEAVLTAFLALGLALIVVEAALPYFNSFSGKSMTLLSEASFTLLLALLLTALGTGLFAGSYPALFLSSLKPTLTLRNMSPLGNRGRRIRRGLIIVQFAVSVGLITCTMIVTGQLRYIQKKDLGVDHENMVVINNNPVLLPRYDAFKKALLTRPGVQKVTSAAQLPTRIGENILINWEGNPIVDSISADYTVVDYDFFKTFNIKILQGRPFSREFLSDETAACIINETAAKIMELENPIGTNIYMGHPAWEESFRTARVIGVVRDFHARSLHTNIRPFVFRMYKPWHQYAFVKIEGERIQETIAGIRETFEKYSPGYPFSYTFLDDYIGRQYISERRFGRLFSTFSLLSIFIACLGLFGLASYMTEQKTKEIGIRKVLGASIPVVIAVTAREFIWLVVLANLIAWPVAYYVMHQWLKEFAYKVNINPLVFGLAAGFTLLIAMLTVSYHSLKAALAKPIDSLRYE